MKNNQTVSIEQLKQELKEYKTIVKEHQSKFNKHPAAVFWADIKTGHIINCNKKAQILMKMTKKQILNMNQTDLHPINQRNEYKEMFKKHIELNGYVNDEAEILNSKGEMIPVTISAYLSTHKNKPIIEGYFYDQSHIQDLRTKHQLYSDIFNHINIGLYVYQLRNVNDDRSLVMIAANETSTKFTQVDKNKLIGKKIDDCFPELRKKHIPEIYANVIRNQKSIHLDDVHYSDERVIDGWFRVTAFPIPHHCVGIAFENITKEKQNEIQRSNYYKELQEALSQIKTLSGLIPICSQCRKIRHDDGYWKKIKSFSRKNQIQFTHGLCPECLDQQYSEYHDKMKTDP